MTNESVKNRPQAEKILEHISQCVITTDLNGVVTYWNRASERTFGYTRKEMLGQSLIKIYPDIAEEQFYEDLELLISGKKIEDQWKCLTKGGSTVWLDLNAKKLADDSGMPVAIIATAHDIQALKEVEKKLEENKAQAQAILETTVDGIITIDEFGKIMSFNQAASEIFGYTEEEIIGENINVLMPDPHQSKHDSYLKQYRDTGEKRIIGSRRELTGKKKDGSLFPMELSVSEVQWGGNRIFTGVVNDISERRRLEKEILRISEEERRRFGQDLHDGLGQLLTGIGLISQNLAHKLKSNGIVGADKVWEIYDLIKEADEYTRSLAHGLTHIDIEEEGLQTALKQLSNRAEKFFNVNCSLRWECDSQINDSMQTLNLYRIAQEAVSNAVKHGKAENIQISLITRNGSVRLTVEDDGIGLSKPSQKEKPKGMGIKIMKYRANIMSGSLEITETVDKKTNVTCSIPHINSKVDGVENGN